MQEITTIKIYRETKKRLDRLKEHRRESYEEVLRKILFILNLSRKNPEKASLMFRRLDVAVKRTGQRYAEVYSEKDDEDLEKDDEKKDLEYIKKSRKKN